MDRMTVRNEAGLAVVNCDGCKTKDGYEMCHLLRCRNRLKDRLCELEDKIERGELLERSASKPQTNADRIRAMSDEELAKEMRSHAFALAACSERAWLEWLKQPAEGDD